MARAYTTCPICHCSKGVTNRGYIKPHNRQVGVDGRGVAQMKRCPGTGKKVAVTA